jgi:hypothetical protein
VRKRRKPPRALLRELEDPQHLDGVTYQQQYVLCSKPTCTKWHGPYWYAFYRTQPTKPNAKSRVRSKYVGKELPPAIVEQIRARIVDGDEQHIAREAERLKRTRKSTRLK